MRKYRAYAKVNLSLDVTGKLENGYHTLRSVMQAVDLFDEITVDTRDDREGVSLSMSTDLQGAYIPKQEKNIAYKAALLLAEHFQLPSPTGISIDIKKRIPMSAGLGGGSSDAAAVILALNEIWNINASLADLSGLAMSLGADVPFCLAANAKNNASHLSGDSAATSTALAEGIGEILSPLPSPGGAVVLIKPPMPLSTPYVYGRYDESSKSVSRPDTDMFVRRLLDRDFLGISSFMVNALESAALTSSTEASTAFDVARGMFPHNAVFISGSGPTVAVYFEEKEEAAAAYRALTDYMDTEDARKLLDSRTRLFLADILQ